MEKDLELTDIERKKIKCYILKSLEDLGKGISIDWDRVSRGTGYCIVFGWIERKDRQRDFVHYYMNYEFDEDKELQYFEMYSTSSVKYTKKMAENWGLKEHNACIKYSDWIKEF